MIELKIDSVSCDVDSASTIVLNYDMDIMSDFDDMREGRKATIEVPSTAINDEIFDNDGYLHAVSRFNQSLHSAQVKCEGEVLFEGSAYLNEVLWREGRMWYSLLICADCAEWAESAAETAFNDFSIDLYLNLAISTIKEQWESDDIAVRFVPVQRDTYSADQSSVSTELVRQITSLEDYHPFLHVETMVRMIFESNGYSLKSDFMESDYFKSLYMSGGFGSSTNSTATKEAMDFYVTRTSDCTVTSDYRGRVYLSPYVAASSVGMIVDPDSVGSVSGCYSNGGCFVEYESAPAFVPLTQVCVGFEYRFRYITPYKIKDRYGLTTFNSFHLSTGHDYEFEVANLFEDKRESLVSSFSYMLCLFDFEDYEDITMYYRLESGALTLYGQITERVTYFTSMSSSFVDVVLIESHSTGLTEYYSKDWAIYNGYVQETGETEVDVTLRSTPEIITPTSPKKFTESFMDCGEPYWEMTLLQESSIKPYFAKHPGCNSYVTFSDIAHHDVSQIKLVESMAHLFNLRILTDDVNKLVYVEPFDDMWDQSQVWDWSDKIDRGGDIEIYDLASEVYKSRKWGYNDGDGVTSRGDGDIPADSEYGFWAKQIKSCVAKSGMETLLSPLYSPSQNNDEGLLWVGDRDDVESLNTYDFTPRIVVQSGTVTFDNVQMPYFTFFDSQVGESLCFEDRDGVTGLNQYYQNQIEMEDRGRVVTLQMKLSVFDVASLFSPSQVAPHLRSIFGLTINGEYARCLLREIVEYSPQKESVKCRFYVVD